MQLIRSCSCNAPPRGGGTPWIPIFPARTRMLGRACHVPEATGCREAELGFGVWWDPQTSSPGRKAEAWVAHAGWWGWHPVFPWALAAGHYLAVVKSSCGPRSQLGLFAVCHIPSGCPGGPDAFPALQELWGCGLAGTTELLLSPTEACEAKWPVQTCPLPSLFPVGGLWLLPWGPWAISEPQEIGHTIVSVWLGGGGKRIPQDTSGSQNSENGFHCM